MGNGASAHSHSHPTSTHSSRGSFHLSVSHRHASNSKEKQILLAAENGDFNLIETLLTEDKTLLTYQNLNGWNCLFWSVFVGHENITRFLIEKYGCDVCIADSHSWTPLHYAASKGFVEIADMLIKNGALLNSTDNRFMWTPLIYACRNGQFEMVRFLVSAGADIHAVDAEKRDGLYWACEKGNTPIAEFLVQRGADINKVDIYGNATVNKIRSDSRDYHEHLIEGPVHPRVPIVLQSDSLDLAHSPTTTALQGYMHSSRGPAMASSKEERDTGKFGARASLKLDSGATSDITNPHTPSQTPTGAPSTAGSFALSQKNSQKSHPLETLESY